MTPQNNDNLSSELAEEGLEAIPELLRVLINNVIDASGKVMAYSTMLLKIAADIRSMFNA